MLPVTTMSWPGCSFSSRTAATTSPSSTVVGSHCGSVRVEETTYFCTWFRYAGDAGRVLGLLRPVAAEVLEGLPAQQQRVGGLVLTAHLGHQVVGVGLGVEPVADHLDRAVERDVLRDDQRPHGSFPPSWMTEVGRPPAGELSAQSSRRRSPMPGSSVHVAVGDARDLLDLADRRPLVAAEPGQRPQVLDPRPAVAHRALPDADVPHPAEDDGAVAEPQRARAATHSMDTGDSATRIASDALARLEAHAGVLGLAVVGREVGAGGVDLLEQRLGGQVDGELAGRLDVAQRVLAAHRRELDDRRVDAGHRVEGVRREVEHALGRAAADPGDRAGGRRRSSARGRRRRALHLVGVEGARGRGLPGRSPAHRRRTRRRAARSAGRSARARCRVPRRWPATERTMRTSQDQHRHRVGQRVRPHPPAGRARRPPPGRPPRAA